MKKSFLALCLGFALTSAFGQEAVPTLPASASVVLPPDLGSKLSSQAYQNAQQLGEELAHKALANLDSPQGRQFQAQAAPLARKADEIADAAVAKDRDKVLQFVGIDPKTPSGLYYMVSWSMPLEMLRAYAAEAMWDGGVLVFKGIPEGMDLNTYIHKNMSKLVYGKGASAVISIDPRLFEAYDIKTVPTIVLTTDRNQLTCNTQSGSVVLDGQTYPYNTCAPLDTNKYWKIEGAVTSDFALREFQKAGAGQAQMYLDALARAGGGGQMAPREQQPFTGDWKDAISPADLQATQDAIAKLQSAQGGGSLTDSLQKAAASAEK